MSVRASAKFGGSGGVHFKEPWLLLPRTQDAGDYAIIDKAAAATASDAVAYFTELANRGAIDSTNWTANTYKTLINLSGSGLVSHIIGPTSAGADITTFEITVDGTLKELPVLTASGQRAMVGVGLNMTTLFTTAAIYVQSMGDLNAAKTIIGDTPANGRYMPPWDFMTMMGTPTLRFNTSLLIRAKHAASITNSTATAYSGAQYRMGL